MLMAPYRQLQSTKLTGVQGGGGGTKRTRTTEAAGDKENVGARR